MIVRFFEINSVLKDVAELCSKAGPSIFPWLMEYLHFCASQLTKANELEAICIVISHLFSECWDSTHSKLFESFRRFKQITRCVEFVIVCVFFFSVFR